MSILTVDDISFSYPDSKLKALDGVSFSVEKGEYVAVLGANGSGKSTLARIICGFLEQTLGKMIVSGEESNEKETNSSLKNKSSLQKKSDSIITGIVFQEPKNQIVSGIVSRDTSFGPENLGLPSAEVEQRTIESLAVNGLLDRALSRTNALSLGQTQKLALSGILALHPDLLVLDEATAMLDPESRAELLGFIDKSHVAGQTIIHITHDAEEAARAQKVIVLNKGKIIFSGTQTEFKINKNIVDLIFGKKLEKRDDYRDFFTAARSVDNKTASSATVADNSKEAGNNTISLLLEHISFSYEDIPVFKDLSVSFERGTLNALIGPSGCGKSTMLELAAGLLIPSAGKISAESRPVLAQQESEAALFESFAADDVAFGARNQGVAGKALVERVKKSMDSAGVPFAQFADRQTFLLSGGEKRKLAIAGILALNSAIIMFDEPTAGLDPGSRYDLMHELQAIARTGKTVIFSTHRMDEADFADRAIAIKNGVMENDTVAHICTADTVCASLKNLAPLDGAKMLASLRKSAAFLGDAPDSKNNPALRMPPVVKYVVFLTLFICSLLFKNIVAASCMVAASIVYAFVEQYPFKRIISSFIKLIPWLIFFCVFQMIFFPKEAGEAVYVNLRWFMVTPSKLILCLRTVLHTFAAFNVICTFAYSTGERELLEGFSALLKPLIIIHIPVRSLVVVVEIIFRFIPLLIDEASSIIKTQLVRGGLGKAKGFMARIRTMLPLFVPMVIQTIKRSESLADALTARYF
jgi:energy-coupling factor transport system permease/ATP-binding protein